MKKKRRKKGELGGLFLFPVFRAGNGIGLKLDGSSKFGDLPATVEKRRGKKMVGGKFESFGCCLREWGGMMCCKRI